MSFGITVKAIIERQGLSQGDLADAVMKRKDYINAILNGRKNAGRKTQELIANVLDIPLGDIISGVAASPSYDNPTATEHVPTLPPSAPAEYIRVSYLEVTPGTGGKPYSANRNVHSFLSFQRAWLHAKGSPAAMGVIRASGNAMKDTIPDGSVVLIDESQKQIVNDRPHLVQIGDHIFIKHLYKIARPGLRDWIFHYGDGDNIGNVLRQVEQFKDGRPREAIKSAYIKDKFPSGNTPGAINFSTLDPDTKAKLEALANIDVDRILRHLIALDEHFEIIGRCLWFGCEL